MTNLIAAVLTLLVGAGLCVLPLRNERSVALGIGSQIVATGLVWAVVLPVLFGGGEVVGELAWAYPVGNVRIRLDPLGAFFLAWSLPMTLLGSVYAGGYLASFLKGPRNVGVHYALLNMTSLSFVFIYTAEHALVFLLGWEIAALAAWLLVIWDHHSQRIRFAGFNYLVSTHLGLIFLVAAFMILYTHSASWHFSALGSSWRALPEAASNGVFLLLLTSFALKSAFFPFHSWLPRAHAAAPAHVSALMSGVIHKAGLYALFRFVLLLGRPDEWIGWFLIGFSVCSAVVGALYTVGQRDLKRLLGYSSTENVGIIGIGFGLGCLGLSWNRPLLVALGFGAGLLHLFNHALFKCLLFYAAGAVYRVTHTIDLERMGGLARLMPWTALGFLVGGLAISALPPFNGFASEFLLYSGILDQTSVPSAARLPLALTAAALAFVGAVSALSITRAFGIAFLGSPRDPTIRAEGEVGKPMLIAIAAHGLGVLMIGLVPAAGFALVRAPTALALALIGADAHDFFMPIRESLTRIGLLSGALILAVLLFVWLRKRLTLRRSAEDATWACGYPRVGPRMQYTSASFSSEFVAYFRSILTLVRKQKLPTTYFPSEAHVATHCVDAVERRLFEVIGRGDSSAKKLAEKLNEDRPGVAFAFGLVAVVLIASLVLLSGCVTP
jgi:hydrogenase-4 component B